MRPFLLTAVLLSVAASAAAQSPNPKPFVVGEFTGLSATFDDRHRTFAVGFDVTVGGPSSRGLQLLAQGGRAFDLTPDRGGEGIPNLMTAWYGAGGVRYASSVWRLRPYIETTAGLAWIGATTDLLTASTGPFYRFNTTAPLASVAAGAQVIVWKGLTVDMGFRAQRFFGDAKATRANPNVGIGWSF